MEELSKKQKKSHDHKFTTWLKNIIFSIVMIAPFLSVMARTIYVQSNQNAKDSYYGETINQSEYVNVDADSLELNKNYLLSIDTNTYSYNSNVSLNIDNLTNFNTSYALSTTAQNAINNNEVKVLRFTKYESNYLLALMRDVNSSSIANIRVNEYTINGNFDLNGYTSNVSNVFQFIFKLVYNDYSYLDNAFDYSINKLHNINVYNWSKNTAIYTAIDNMTNGLGMGENNTLALLLAYWSILTAVYIVFDIIIFCFTKITHFINSD